MSINIKELRRKTGMTQKGFAEHFGIPLSTLRKWEQGEASPPDYLIHLIANALPAYNTSFRVIDGKNGCEYYYDKDRSRVLDMKGNAIAIKESLDGVKEQNLKLYLSDLFERFYEIQNRFEDDCYYDKREDINWI